MNKFFTLTLVLLALSCAKADYDWKVCANGVIDALRDGLDTIQDGINGQWVAAAKDAARLTKSVAAAINGCKSTTGAEYMLNNEAVEECFETMAAVVLRFVETEMSTFQKEGLNMMTALPLISELQAAHEKCATQAFFVPAL